MTLSLYSYNHRPHWYMLLPTRSHFSLCPLSLLERKYDEMISSLYLLTIIIVTSHLEPIFAFHHNPRSMASTQDNFQISSSQGSNDGNSNIKPFCSNILFIECGYAAYFILFRIYSCLVPFWPSHRLKYFTHAALGMIPMVSLLQKLPVRKSSMTLLLSLSLGSTN